MDSQLSEEIVEWVSQQRRQGGVNRRDLVIKKTELERTYFKCVHINKEVPTGQHFVEDSHMFSGKSL